MFFVSADGCIVGKAVIISKNKKTFCFSANVASKLGQRSFFADATSWMRNDIMKKVLQKLKNI